MKLSRLFHELHRRHVLRVVGAYAVAAWVAVEVYTTVQPILFENAVGSDRIFVIIALAGFPVVFALAWIFDITPEGIRRTAALAEAEAAIVDTPPRRVLSARASGFFGLGILVAFGALAAYAGIRGPVGATSPDEIRSIAVLPFENLSGDPAQDYLSDGIAEDLLNRLTQVGDLNVPARTSSFGFRDDEMDVRAIGRRLNVQAVVEGSVQREGDRVRVHVQLVDATTGYRIWADTFDGDATDVFALQDMIGAAIVDRLRLRLAAVPEAGERGTSNPRAHELYLLGMQRWHHRTDRDLRQALAYFEDALAEDPDFALAHAALAQTYAVLPAYGTFPVDTAVMRGSAAAARAIALDPSLAEAYAAMGQIVQNFEWDLPGAERYYQRALDYSRTVTALQWYAETLLLTGDYDAAQKNIDEVLARDPLSPVALYGAAYVLTARGRLEPALAAWRELLRLHPQFELGLVGFTWTAMAAGDQDAAVGALLRLAATAPERAAVYQAVAEAVGDPSLNTAARTALANSTLALSERAGWLMVIGDRGAALDALERSFAGHADVNLPFAVVHPVFTPLRKDARFRAIADGLGVSLRG